MEPNTDAVAATPAVSPPSAAQADSDPMAVLRGTPEYGAMLDLELWRTAERQRFLASLERERAEHRDRLTAEFAARDAARVAELDGLRAELETMAQGLAAAGTALQKRIAALERREAAHDARRADTARVHEQAMLETEARARRLVEEARLRADQEEARGREKEVQVRETLARLSALHQEHTQLQGLLTRLQGREGHDRAALLAATTKGEQLAALVTAARAEATASAAQRDDALAKNTELKEACGYFQAQLLRLAASHNAVLERLHAEQQRALAAERERLVQDERRLHAAAAAGGGGVGTPRRVWANEGIATGGRGGSNGGGGGIPTTPAAVASSDVSQLRALVEGMAQQAQAQAMNNGTRGGPKAGASSGPQRWQGGAGAPVRRRRAQFTYVPVGSTPTAGGGGASAVAAAGNSGAARGRSAADGGRRAVSEAPPPTAPRGRSGGRSSRGGGGASAAATAAAFLRGVVSAPGSGNGNDGVSVSSLSDSAAAEGKYFTEETPQLPDTTDNDEDHDDNDNDNDRDSEETERGNDYRSDDGRWHNDEAHGAHDEPHSAHARDAHPALAAARQVDDDHRWAQPRPHASASTASAAHRPPRYEPSSADDAWAAAAIAGFAPRTTTAPPLASGVDVSVATDDDCPPIDVAQFTPRAADIGVPPLAPPPRTPPPLLTGLGPRSEPRRSHATSGHASPTGAAGAGATTAAAASAAAAAAASAASASVDLRADVTDFVMRLRRNRERLLGTGVYTDEDPLIREMSAKIAAYEGFLQGNTAAGPSDGADGAWPRSEALEEERS